jgi:phytanoyl-CoA hydroxylase
MITTPAHRTLTDDEIAAYDRDGFVLIPGVFPREELATIDREISRLRETADHSDNGMERVMALGLQGDLTRRYVRDPRLLALVDRLVRPGIAIYSAKLMGKRPNRVGPDVTCHWHQDDAYYSQNSSSSCRMSVWFPLQDADVESGCLRVVPGSHRHGLLPSRDLGFGECRLAFRDGAEDIPGAITVPVPAGSVLLFHALLWHCSRGNATDRPRRAFIVSYQDALAVAGNGSQHTILEPA